MRKPKSRMPKFLVGQVIAELRLGERPLRYGKVKSIRWDREAGPQGGFIVSGDNLTSTHESWFRPLTAKERGPAQRKAAR
jgi:hypothetical protein